MVVVGNSGIRLDPKAVEVDLLADGQRHEYPLDPLPGATFIKIMSGWGQEGLGTCANEVQDSQWVPSSAREP